MTGYLYKTIFNPFYIEAYLLDTDDDNAGNNQFRFIVYLQSTSEYILIVTTQNQNTVGKYTVIVTGYITVHFSDEYLVGNYFQFYRLLPIFALPLNVFNCLITFEFELCAYKVDPGDV